VWLISSRVSLFIVVTSGEYLTRSSVRRKAAYAKDA
jgi:hypothetical protein